MCSLLQLLLLLLQWLKLPYLVISTPSLTTAT